MSARTTTSEQGNTESCYFPMSMDNAETPPKRVPGVFLFPPPSAEATHAYIKGYFHPELADLGRRILRSGSWITIPDVLIHGSGVQGFDTSRMSGRTAAAIEQGLYQSRAARRFNDTGRQGLLQIMRAADIDNPARHERMRLVPGVASSGIHRGSRLLSQQIPSITTRTSTTRSRDIYREAKRGYSELWLEFQDRRHSDRMIS